MRVPPILLLVVALTALVGCNQGSPGGPGADTSAAREPLYGQDNDTFNLSVPVLSTSLKQGETKALSIGIRRGKNFDEDVELTLSNLPKGVTPDPADLTIKHSETEAKFTLHATGTAALGNFSIKVSGHPTKGADASADLKITIDKK